MKKHFFLIFILPLLFQFNYSYGQESKFALGLEIGPNYTFLYGNSIYKQGKKTNIRAYRGISLHTVSTTGFQSIQD